MAQYVPLPSSFKPSQVGALYHVGIGDGTNQYGYIFQPDVKKGMIERSNVAEKGALIQYSSPNLIDRDFVFYPRVTQGDYSGGGLQTVLLNQNQYFDSDLEVQTPGYLTLRAAWGRQNLVSATGAQTYQSVCLRGLVYTAWGNSNLYNSNGTAMPTPTVNPTWIDTDGTSVIAAGPNGFYAYYSPTSNTWSAPVNLNTGGTTKQIWHINLGTSGRYIYNTPDKVALWKFDVSSAQTNISVPLGFQAWTIMDVCPYQTGIAIATRDSVSGFGGGQSDIWYHDGQNLTRIVHLEQYDVVGMTNCLGNLFVTANSTGGFEPPVVLMISSGSVSVVVRPGSPLITSTTATIGAPVSSGQFVCFALLSPQINNVTTTSYIGVWDSVNEAFSHLGNDGTDDAPQGVQPRQLAFSGRAVAFPMTDGSGNSVLQYQADSSFFPTTHAYRLSGVLVSSKIDFATPAIPKRFRRIEVQHSPLTSGQRIQVNAFVDQDPLVFTTSLTPVPPTATVVNTTVGSAQTILTFGTATVGRTLYYSLALGGGGTSTPSIQYVAVECGGTWTWEFTFDCSERRRLLNAQGFDQQGVTGKDLYFLLRNAYENGTQLTLYLAENVSYTVQIESVDVVSPSYTDHIDPDPVNADQEWQVHVILDQVA